jgi:hypothetical protein
MHWKNFPGSTPRSVEGLHDSSTNWSSECLQPTGLSTSADWTWAASCSANRNLPPVLWRERFPAGVLKDLVSVDNPTGSVTNLNLEVAGSLIQHEAYSYAQNSDIREHDNSIAAPSPPKVHTSSESKPCPSDSIDTILLFPIFSESRTRWPTTVLVCGTLLAQNLFFILIFNIHIAKDGRFGPPSSSMLSALTAALRRQLSQPI